MIPVQGLARFTWATKPTIANWPSYTPIILEDVGVGGSLWQHDNVNWRPVGGQFLLCSYAGSPTNPVATLTGTTAAKFTLPGGDKPIPADLLIPDTSIITAEIRMRKTGATATVYGTIRVGTAAGTGDPIMGHEQLGVGTNSDQRLKVSGLVDTTTRMCLDQLMVDDSMVGGSGWLDTTTNINTAAAMYVTPQVHSGNAADTYNLLGFEVVVKV